MMEIDELQRRIECLARTNRAAEKIAAVMKTYGNSTFSVEFLRRFLETTTALDISRYENLKERPPERQEDVYVPPPKPVRSPPARHQHAPDSSPPLEEDIASPSENVWAAASCLTDEVVLLAVQSSAGSVVPELNPEIELPDAPQDLAAGLVDATIGQNPAERPSQIARISVTGPSIDALGMESGKRRKPSVRLTDKEREVAIRLGLRSSPVAPTYLARSVLDDYEPVKRTSRQPSKPSKNVLVKAVTGQHEQCAYCDRLFGSLALMDGKFITLRAVPEHFVPRAKRLNNSSSNIVAACQICNRLKDSRVFTSMEQARAVLQAAWEERGWISAPLLVPFKLTMPTCFN